MFVATGSFSPKNGHPVKFCVDFNPLKSIRAPKSKVIWGPGGGGGGTLHQRAS